MQSDPGQSILKAEITKGMNQMAHRDFDQYQDEAKKKWGATDAYREYQEKTKDYSRTT